MGPPSYPAPAIRSTSLGCLPHLYNTSSAHSVQDDHQPGQTMTSVICPHVRNVKIACVAVFVIRFAHANGAWENYQLSRAMTLDINPLTDSMIKIAVAFLVIIVACFVFAYSSREDQQPSPATSVIRLHLHSFIKIAFVVVLLVCFAVASGAWEYRQSSRTTSDIGAHTDSIMKIAVAFLVAIVACFVLDEEVRKSSYKMDKPGIDAVDKQFRKITEDVTHIYHNNSAVWKAVDDKRVMLVKYLDVYPKAKMKLYDRISPFWNMQKHELKQTLTARAEGWEYKSRVWYFPLMFFLKECHTGELSRLFLPEEIVNSDQIKTYQTKEETSFSHDCNDISHHLIEQAYGAREDHQPSPTTTSPIRPRVHSFIKIAFVVVLLVCFAPANEAWEYHHPRRRTTSVIDPHTHVTHPRDSWTKFAFAFSFIIVSRFSLVNGTWEYHQPSLVVTSVFGSHTDNMTKIAFTFLVIIIAWFSLDEDVRRCSYETDNPGVDAVDKQLGKITEDVTHIFHKNVEVGKPVGIL